MILTETKLYQGAKKAFPAYYDIDFWMSVITKSAEGEWFTPNNKDEEAFTICIEMSAVHLIAMKRVPIWKNDSLHGSVTMFMYKLDLDYSKNNNNE